MKKYLRFRKIIFIGIFLVSFFEMGCSSKKERNITRFHKDYTVRKTYSSTIVTGTACAADAKSALRAAKKTASFNLRSVKGDTKYLEIFHEIKSFFDNDQTCITMAAETR